MEDSRPDRISNDGCVLLLVASGTDCSWIIVAILLIKRRTTPGLGQNIAVWRVNPGRKQHVQINMIFRDTQGGALLRMCTSVSVRLD